MPRKSKRRAKVTCKGVNGTADEKVRGNSRNWSSEKIRHMSTKDLVEHMCQRAAVIDKEYKSLVGGYYRYPDFDKALEHNLSMNRGECGGNCFYANLALYQEMYKTNKDIKLVIMRMESPAFPKGMNHCIIIDGDVFYDNSQFREIKGCFKLYKEGNNIVAHFVAPGDVHTYSRKDWNKVLDIVVGNGFGWTAMGPPKFETSEATLKKAAKRKAKRDRQKKR